MATGAKRSQKKTPSGHRYMTRGEIVQILSSQKADALVRRQHETANAAKRKFRLRKSDRGKLVFIGVSGQRSPELKGRKGFLIYVTKTGKKQLVTEKRSIAPHKPRKLGEINIPQIKKFRKAAKDFVHARLEKTGTGKAVVKGSGVVEPNRVWDFSDKVVDSIAKSLKKTISGQRSHRSFLVKAIVFAKLADGSTRSWEVNVPIARADHAAIKLGGLKNFVRQKFYAFMARELAFDGFVTSGSANHIRRLKQNKGLPKEKWTQTDGEMWRGNEAQVIQIQSIEWQILQAS